TTCSPTRDGPWTKNRGLRTASPYAQASRALTLLLGSLNMSATDVMAPSRIQFMSRVRDAEDLLPLTPPVFHILVALCDGERHGYAIQRQVAEDTDGALKLGPGTLYGCLQRMLAAH